MTTTLLLVNTEAPYKFECLGIREIYTLNYRESNLFPIGQVVELSSGKFPINDYSDLYVDAYVLGGKAVNVVGFTKEYDADTENQSSPCMIQVVSTVLEEREADFLIALAPEPGYEPAPASEPVASEPIPLMPVGSEPVASEPVGSEPVASEPVASEPVASEPVASEPAPAEPVANNN